MGEVLAGAVLAVVLALAGCSVGERDPRGEWLMDEWRMPRHEGEFGRIRSWDYRL